MVTSIRQGEGVEVGVCDSDGDGEGAYRISCKGAQL